MKAGLGVTRRGLLAGASAAMLATSGKRPFPTPPRSPIRFVDITKSAGIIFRHENAATSQKYLIETMGSGCAWIDYDQNGLLDLYLVNSAATQVFKPGLPLRSALYRNNGDGTFTDVTGKAGVGAEGLFGMGVAVGDYDNDGFPDLLVLGYGRSILYHNNGDGSFTDVTAHAGVANSGQWASSAAWFDYDNDGFLDLVVANYVDWSPERNYYCGSQGAGMRSYCHPDDYHGEAPVLYHNNRDGTFTEVAYEAGVAVSEDGVAESGMGTDAADATGKGCMDLIVGHLDLQMARFYRNLGHGLFEDATFSAKLGYATFHTSVFGARFLDYDNDGRRDIFMAACHVLDNIERYRPGTSYAEPKLMFHNAGNGVFVNVSDQLGPDFQTPCVSRGAAVGDFDNDGDLDILVSNNGGPAQLLRNDGGNANHWLQILPIGTRSNRDGVGARLRLSAGDLTLYEQKKGGMSY